MSGIVIVGAGQAAASMAAKLRAQGYVGSLTILGEEPVAPYQRPPLSKGYLLGEMPLDRLTLRGADWYAANDVRLVMGAQVTAIDRAAKRVEMGDESLPYDQLALCTGAVPRRLPAAIGGDLAGVYTVRSLADVDAMEPEFTAGRHLVVIGGGYIGLEAAAVAAKLGLTVTLIEAAPRILGRVACSETADAIRALHVDHGVKILEGMRLKRLVGEARVSGAELEDGRVIPADFVIVGIGVAPSTALAEAAGLRVENGIAVDEQLRTSDPAIWAAGDCASFPGPDGRMRLESVGNAIDMGECVAENMLGAGKAYQPKPWFWSDQFDMKLQIAGLNAGYDRVVSRIGDGSSFWYFRGPRLIAVDALNDPRAYMIGKRLIEGGKAVTPEEIETATDLKALMK
ncbi:MAG: NAD(P)/FAD-dependent oxidoreductase [Paenirhodobacter sp.]|uniref:NAD(P)/FAD-dependent oxidoreductase n=1 Tax=Paenirhodobacter sp. TaxID=1965326 RepID=UPI003D10F507